MSVEGGGVKPVMKCFRVGWRAFAKSRELHSRLMRGDQLADKTHGSRMSAEQGKEMLDYTRDNCPLGVKAGMVRRVTVGGTACQVCPLVRTMNLGEFWMKYQAWREDRDYEAWRVRNSSRPEVGLCKPCGDTDAGPAIAKPLAWRPGRGTFHQFLKYVTVEAKK